MEVSTIVYSYNDSIFLCGRNFIIFRYKVHRIARFHSVGIAGLLEFDAVSMAVSTCSVCEILHFFSYSSERFVYISLGFGFSLETLVSACESAHAQGQCSTGTHSSRHLVCVPGSRYNHVHDALYLPRKCVTDT